MKLMDCITSFMGKDVTISSSEISCGKIGESSLDQELLKRLDRMEKMIEELYYPYKRSNKND